MDDDEELCRRAEERKDTLGVRADREPDKES